MENDLAYHIDLFFYKLLIISNYPKAITKLFYVKKIFLKPWVEYKTNSYRDHS